MPRRTRTFAAAALAAQLLVPGALSAQPADTAAPATAVPTIVVSATRIESTLATSPDSITVVTREEIEGQQRRFVADVLETVPGVQVSRTGQLGGFVGVFLRGASSGQTLVLIDGVRANNAFNGRFDFLDMPVDNVERIEVIRGPQSTRYGSDALGGVINIVTRRGAAAPTGSALVEAGTFDSVRVRGAIAARVGTLGVSAEGSALQTDNERPNSQYSGAGGSFAASWQALERMSLELSAEARSSEAGTPNDRFTNDPNDTTNTDTTRFTLGTHAQPAAWWDLRLTLASGHEKVLFDGPAPNPPYFGGDTRAETVADTRRADLQNVFAVGAAHRVFLGFSYDDTPVDYTSTSPFGDASIDRSVTSRAVSLQYDFSPSEWFTASLGGRVDDFDTFGSHSTWRGGARYTLASSGTILRANVGTGFRAPTIADLYYPNFSNPNLEPEESLGWDVGVEQPLLDGRLQVGATWFQNKFDNLISYSAASQRPENIAEAKTAGLEGFVQWSPTAALSLSGAWTWLSVAEDTLTGEQLLRRPDYTANVAARYRFPRWVSVDTIVYFVGESADKNFTSFPAENVTNDAYVKWDAAVTVSPLAHVDLTARVENLLDDQYEEAFGFPALGRAFWFGAAVRF
jgi:vitamin B12 transporter